MQYGTQPRLDQFVENQNLESQKVQSMSKSSEIKTNHKTEELQKKVSEKTKEVNDIYKTDNNYVNIQSKYEVSLTNVNFGYNSETRDFYVKVERGNVENQYPTEEMMKIKAYLKNIQNENI